MAVTVAGAGTARATQITVRVVNDAAPGVTIVAPRDGATLPAGRASRVVVRSRDADGVEMSLDGAPAWSSADPVVVGDWTPSPGRHRLVAVAHRDGAPDAVDAVTIVATTGAPEAAAVGPRPAGGAAPPSSRTAPAITVRRTPPRPGAARPPAGRAHGPVAPAPPARAADEGGGGGRSPLAAVLHFLSSPERAAWTAAFPLLLILAAIAYAMLQRFIDGGEKLAFRGRGRPQDEVIEF